ncbi:MAG: SDR family oxidoreductase [Myxococcota bacterium]
MGRLQGKVAIVTGSGQGIGRASAECFAREGARVVVAEIRADTGRACAAAIEAAGGEALFVETDVTSADAVEALVAQSLDRFGSIDVLFNCAGGSIPEDVTITEVDMEAVWEHTLSLDLKGTMLCCRHVIPEMIRAGGGSIVNSTSVVALRGGYPVHVYTAAKGGVIAFTRGIAGSYTTQGIRANAVAPGLVLSERLRERFGENAAAAMASQEDHPFSVGEPPDIAAVALFLASDESRMVTGAVIPADGGLSAF